MNTNHPDLSDAVIGIYLRLSKEDSRNYESQSIKNQRDYLTRWINRSGGTVSFTFVDDGYSGTHFSRPGFNSMIEHILAGKIDTVAVKDISRLGRDYIAVGTYIEKFFPENRIRFISINDNYDSKTALSGYSDIIPFKAVLFDLTAKDTSNKIKSSLETKMKNGEFTGAFAPYGYKKSAENKNILIPDSGCDYIVKRIFSMYVQGISMSKIAQTLNNENVLSPLVYKKINSSYSNPNTKTGLWSQQTIKRILSDSVYTGKLSQGKNKKLSYKIKKSIKVERHQWIVTENTHEPIIHQDTFLFVQNLLQTKSSAKYICARQRHLLSGLLYCSECGSKLTFRRDSRNKKFHLICSGYIKGNGCSRHFFYEEDVNDRVWADLREHFNIKKLLSISEKLQTKHFIEPNNLGPKIKILEDKIRSLYEDKYQGIISADTFNILLIPYLNEKKTLENCLNSDLNPFNHPIDIEDFIQNEKEHLAPQLIEKIKISQKGEMKIKYKFIN